ncbi:MAG TPA: hypothetical protein VH853_04315 [Polyangia bacterium]|nr:hypothetical protein [Polyangia bacterium]
MSRPWDTLVPGHTAGHLDFRRGDRERPGMIWLGRFTAAFLVAVVLTIAIAWARTARAQAGTAAETPRALPAELKKRIRKANDAYARSQWEEATFQLREALKMAPDDARLRDKLRRALERRAQACEARAAHPTPPPPGIADGPRQGLVAVTLEERRWHAALKRAALQARADAEAERPHPDDQKLTRLRRDLAAVEAEEAEMAGAVSDEQKQAAADQAARDKAFGGVSRVGVGGSKSPDAGLR